MTESPFKNARREAHEACPCRGYAEQDCGLAPRPCTCSLAIMPTSESIEVKDADECEWPGHAAIDAVCAAARGEGERKGRDEETEACILAVCKRCRSGVRLIPAANNHTRRIHEEENERGVLVRFKCEAEAIRRRIAARGEAARKEDGE